jgi:nitroimidazol reductase NimA-like FMN-containing flavoprotein (pyridoxamine 5'-phosphate oxidase superfamily)
MRLTMSVEEREAFLAEPHVGLIGIEHESRPPLVVPIWYDFDPGIGVWVTTGSESEKGRLLKRAERYSLCAQSEEGPLYKYVSVEGPIVEIRRADREKDLRPMAHRYLGQQVGDIYLASATHRSTMVFTMRPARWRTVDYGKIREAAP